jgi:hypothetical protein
MVLTQAMPFSSHIAYAKTLLGIEINLVENEQSIDCCYYGISTAFP